MINGIYKIYDLGKHCFDSLLNKKTKLTRELDLAAPPSRLFKLLNQVNIHSYQYLEVKLSQQCSILLVQRQML